MFLLFAFAIALPVSLIQGLVSCGKVEGLEKVPILPPPIGRFTVNGGGGVVGETMTGAGTTGVTGVT